jgi:chromosome partitioning protein
MTVISVFNQKGGSGKTMLSVHLAVAAHLAGRKVAILDLDPQGSASHWRKARGETAEPVVVKVPDGSLERAVAGAKADGFDFILIDAPPTVTAATARIIGAADLVVIPIRPEPFDLAAIPDTIKLVGTQRYVFVLSDCPPRAPEIEEAREALLKLGRPVFGPINNWRSMWRSLIAGQAVSEFEPDGKPAEEIQAVCDSILKEIS